MKNRLTYLIRINFLLWTEVSLKTSCCLPVQTYVNFKTTYIQNNKIIIKFLINIMIYIKIIFFYENCFLFSWFYINYLFLLLQSWYVCNYHSKKLPWEISSLIRLQAVWIPYGIFLKFSYKTPKFRIFNVWRTLRYFTRLQTCFAAMVFYAPRSVFLFLFISNR